MGTAASGPARFRTPEDLARGMDLASLEADLASLDPGEPAGVCGDVWGCLVAAAFERAFPGCWPSVLLTGKGRAAVAFGNEELPIDLRPALRLADELDRLLPAFDALGRAGHVATAAECLALVRDLQAGRAREGGDTWPR